MDRLPRPHLCVHLRGGGRGGHPRVRRGLAAAHVCLAGTERGVEAGGESGAEIRVASVAPPQLSTSGGAVSSRTSPVEPTVPGGRRCPLSVTLWDAWTWHQDQGSGWSPRWSGQHSEVIALREGQGSLQDYRGKLREAAPWEDTEWGEKPAG